MEALIIGARCNEVQGLGDRCQRLTGRSALDGLLALIICQFGFAAELHTIGHGVGVGWLGWVEQVI